MRIDFRQVGIALLALGSLCAGAAASGAKIHRAPTASHSKTGTSISGHSKKKHAHRRKAVSHRMHGQQSIDAQRATQIQQALIREHYLSGDPSGEWDAATQAAMVKYQADNGWQTKLAPDARALIKLGLGPDHSGALSAKSSSPSLPRPDPVVDSNAGFIAASGVNP